MKNAAGADGETACNPLRACHFSCKHAIVMILKGMDYQGAKETLEKAGGHISRAVGQGKAEG